MSNAVRDQYERFPYPPVPWIALPRRGQGRHLRREISNPRILVAGAGTFEAVVIAQAFPKAREIVAIDLSQKSLSLLRRRYRLARTTRFFQKWPPLNTHALDLYDYSPSGTFDLIFASNLMQHVSDPARMLQKFSQWLSPQGRLRVVTYPRSSRIWMRETSRFLAKNGLTSQTPQLLQKCRETLQQLPKSHPIRSCFESQPEIVHPTGLVDAFFNAYENPMSFLNWKEATARVGLTLDEEEQSLDSRSTFLEKVLNRKFSLDAWQKLQVLDDLLEVCSNPILWFSKSSPIEMEPTLDEPAFMDSKEEVQFYLARAKLILKDAGISLDEVLKALREKVGTRPLPGLSILEHLT